MALTPRILYVRVMANRNAPLNGHLQVASLRERPKYAIESILEERLIEINQQSSLDY